MLLEGILLNLEKVAFIQSLQVTLTLIIGSANNFSIIWEKSLLMPLTY